MNLDDIKLSPLEYHDVTVLGDRQPRYAQGGIVKWGTPEITIHPGEGVTVTPNSPRCAYCRSITVDESHCRSCGAPL